MAERLKPSPVLVFVFYKGSGEGKAASAHANVRAYASSAAQGNGVLFPRRNGSKPIGIADEAHPCPRRPKREEAE